MPTSPLITRSSNAAAPEALALGTVRVPVRLPPVLYRGGNVQRWPATPLPLLLAAELQRSKLSSDLPMPLRAVALGWLVMAQIGWRRR